MNPRNVPLLFPPLGATLVEGPTPGATFAVWSEHAERVEVCLFDPWPARTRAHTVIPLTERMGPIHWVFVPGVVAGQHYGFRAHGRYEPSHGLRFNPARVLVDPYARAIANEPDWKEPFSAHNPDVSEQDLMIDERSNEHVAMRSVVVDPSFDWQNDKHPRTPWNDSVLYEIHVRGATMMHPEIPPALRGTYAGLCTDPMIDHFRSLGITALELLPVHEFVDDPFLVRAGRKNYWGYNTVGFFAPAGRYSSRGRAGGQIDDFKTMVRRLHHAGIEVILDVVFNHSAEGNHLGPMLSFRGLDNPTYYRLSREDPRFYMDFTGCGNSLDLRHPHVLRLVMDSLRYWVEEMHVDGFRFDLASTLAREDHGVDLWGGFFDSVQQDPVLATVKLIAEPWDVGDGGYQVGRFPFCWAEWNDRYRDASRRFWKGDSHCSGELATRIVGSSDLYRASGRGPWASVNFITCHDGFTLRDLVSYDSKHNEANGEDNRDGTSTNHSWNHGVEGETPREDVLALRARTKRNLLATLLLSHGTPMLLAGDEMGRTQRGNNNAYCQDSDISWFNWNNAQLDRDLFAFVRSLLAVRKAHPALRPMRYTSATATDGVHVEWLRPDATTAHASDWNANDGRTIIALMTTSCDAVLVAMNGHDHAFNLTLPDRDGVPSWQLVVDTFESVPGTEPISHPLQSVSTIHPRSLKVFVPGRT